MKIFISHSSNDKWIARRISEDLVALGAETFLDEKDIETGESIDDAIQHHLKESDELVMLVSPSALSSHWVLIEIGGAKALSLRLIPILLHVGPNELPGPLPKHLARDLNDVELYYTEVRKRVAKSKEPAAAPKPKPKVRRPKKAAVYRSSWKPKVGDRVKVTPPPASEAGQHALGYNLDMEQYRGVTTTVEAITDGTPRLAADRQQWWWPSEWLSPVLAEDS